jgi:hypothetical protein
MSDPAVMTDLRCEGVFTLAAPVLQVDGHYFTEDLLFKDEKMQTAFIEEAVGKWVVIKRGIAYGAKMTFTTGKTSIG